MYLRMNVCMYLRTYVRMYVYMYVGRYVCMYVCKYVKMYRDTYNNCTPPEPCRFWWLQVSFAPAMISNASRGNALQGSHVKLRNQEDDGQISSDL